MNYLLTILSSGRPVYLERALASLARFLEPKPAAVYVFDDGDSTSARIPSELVERCDPGYRWHASPTRLGQCAAQAWCWQAAAESEHPWVFHMEDDYVLLRPTDIRELASVMEAVPTVAQMALVRTPWGAEVEHGGYIAQSPGWYERMETPAPWWHGQGLVPQYEWIAQVRNWTNAPALFRTDLARVVEFPAEPGCETTLGPRIREAFPGSVFGLCGWGEAWCSHIGVNRAPGSHGY